MICGAGYWALSGWVNKLSSRVETLEQDQLFNMKVLDEHIARLQALEDAYGAHVHARGDGKNNTAPFLYG